MVRKGLRLRQPEQDNNVVRQLRKALKAEQARNKQFQEQLDTLSKANRERIVQDVLSSKGLKNPSKVARLIPQDLEPTADAVSAWLTEFADVFGLEQETAPKVPAADVTEFRRMDAASGSAPQLSGEAELLAKMMATTSPAELAALLAANSG